MDELDEFLHKLRPDGVQQAGSRTVGITGGQNKGEEVCGDEADRGGCDAYCEICHVDRDPDKVSLSGGFAWKLASVSLVSGSYYCVIHVIMAITLTVSPRLSVQYHQETGIVHPALR